MNNKRTNKNFGNLKNVKLILIKHIVDEVNSKWPLSKKKKSELEGGTEENIQIAKGKHI